jgi:phage terminase small subunit
MPISSIKREPKLTIKRRKWANEYIKSGNAKASAMKVYDTKDPATGASIGYDNVHNPTVHAYIQKVLNDEGLTDSKVARRLNKMLEASTSKEALSQAKVADGIRISELIFRLKDRFPAERKQIDKRTLTMSLKGKSSEELEAVLDNTISEAQKFTKLIKTHIVSSNDE